MNMKNVKKPIYLLVATKRTTSTLSRLTSQRTRALITQRRNLDRFPIRRYSYFIPKIGRHRSIVHLRMQTLYPLLRLLLHWFRSSQWRVASESPSHALVNHRIVCRLITSCRLEMGKYNYTPCSWARRDSAKLEVIANSREYSVSIGSIPIYHTLRESL